MAIRIAPNDDRPIQVGGDDRPASRKAAGHRLPQLAESGPSPG